MFSVIIDGQIKLYAIVTLALLLLVARFLGKYLSIVVTVVKTKSV